MDILMLHDYIYGNKLATKMAIDLYVKVRRD